MNNVILLDKYKAKKNADNEREERIFKLYERIIKASSMEDARKLWVLYKTEINARSDKQVKQMEVERGLVY